jgi:hypothetical protein
MSTLKDVFSAVKEVLLLTNKIENLGQAVYDASIELKDHDRRLVRLETIVEMAQRRQNRIQEDNN